MSSSLNGSYSFHNNGIEGEVMGSRPISCVCNLPITKIWCLKIPVSGHVDSLVLQ